MLSASIPLSSASKGTFSAENEVAAATELTAANSSGTGFEKNALEQNGQAAADQSVNLFSGQLQDALNGTQESLPQTLLLELNKLADTQASLPEAAAFEQLSMQEQSDSALQLDGAQALNPEQWLQAMLGQQQLQLQTRDSAVAVKVTQSGSSDAEAIAESNRSTTVNAAALGVQNSALQGGAGFSGNAQILEQTTAQSVNQATDLSLHQSNQQTIQPVSQQAIQQIRQKTVLQANGVGAEESIKKIGSVNVHSVQSANAAESGNAANQALTGTSGGLNSSTISLANFASISASELGASDSSVVQTASALVAGIDATQRAQQAQSSTQTSPTLNSPEAKWGEQLLHTLRDQVQLQIQQKIQNATIRLDPPELGSLEIYLSREGGRLHVQITASQADVARLIQQTSDRLRQELSGPQFTQVNIQTSAEGQSGQQQSRQRYASDEMILANEQAFVGNETQTTRTSDVLVSV